MTSRELPELADFKEWLAFQGEGCQREIFYKARLDTLQSEALLGREIAWDKPAPLSYIQQIGLIQAGYEFGYAPYRRPDVDDVLEVKLRVVSRELEKGPRFAEYIEEKVATELAKQLLKQGYVRRELLEHESYGQTEIRYTLYFPASK
jgi:hypothetical protein